MMDSHVAESGKSCYVLQDNGKEYKVSDDSSVSYNPDKPYPGMTKEHLLQHSSKPLWRTLRLLFSALIVICWLALIAAVIAIIVIHPRCKAAPSQDWWKKSVIYRVYVRSFQDTNGDGIGDLNGVASRLDYLKDNLGVKAISLSPFYRYTHGEDEFSIVNHTEVDADYGTIDDFKNLVDAVQQREMQLIVDFVPGTTSDEHIWFSRSATDGGRDNLYRNYYIWQNGNDTQPPNNWRSVYNFPAWTWKPNRDQVYLHQFRKEQPDLNLRNHNVQKELENILAFWLDAGVDGFYVRQSAYLFEDYDLRNEMPASDSSTNNTDDYDYYDHKYTFGLPEINDMFARWRHLLDEYTNGTGPSRFLTADIKGTIKQTMYYYGRYGRDGVDFPMNYGLYSITKECNGACVKGKIDDWLDIMPADKWPTWMVGDENVDRVHTRTDANVTRALTMLSMMLPGTQISYYGDEIGMVNSNQSPSSVGSMDQPMRSPMQWKNSSESGFTANCTGICQPWMPVNEDYPEKNVESQLEQDNSMLTMMKTMTDLRNNPTLQYGEFRYILTDDNVISFVREFDGETNYFVAINFGQTEVKMNYKTSDKVALEGTVEAFTHPGGAYKTGGTVDTTEITLKPHEGVVLSWDYMIKQY